MDSLINARFISDVGAGREAQATHQTGAQVADDVTVEVGGDQHVELLRALHQLHAQGIDDAVVGLDVGVILGHFAEGAQEQAVGQLHDVGFVHSGDLFAAVFPGVVKGKAADLLAGRAGDELDAVGDVVGEHVLDALIQVLGILAHDDEVNVLKTGRYARQRVHRAQVGVGGKALAQLHIDAAEALADGRSRRAFQCPAARLDGVQRAGGDQLAAGFGVLGTGLTLLPFNAGVQCGRDSTHAFGDLAANAIAWDQYCFHKNTFPFPVLFERLPAQGGLTQRKCCNILQLYLLWAGLSTRFFIQTVSKRLSA